MLSPDHSDLAPTANSSNTDAHVTVCVCTRDRAVSLETLLRSLARQTYRNVDLIIVDQSATTATAHVVEALRASIPPLTYIHSATTGSATAHNIALRYARGPLIAFTDDDCETPPNWLSLLVAYLADHPAVALVCGDVHSAPHDHTKGFIPTYLARRQRIIASPWRKWRERGIGANMTFRLDALHRIGPFDELLGSGAPLYACLDGDIAYRILRAGYHIATLPSAHVLHHGFRTWDQGRSMMRHVSIGVAAAYTKHLRLGDLAALPTLLIEWSRCVSWPRLLALRPRSGVARFFSYGYGILHSHRFPIDRHLRVYRRPTWLPATIETHAAPPAYIQASQIISAQLQREMVEAPTKN